MIEYEIYIADTAKEDLVLLYEFIRDEWENKPLADKTYLDLQKCINSLDSSPERNPIAGNLFSIKYKRYRILYRINRKKRIVKITHIIYGRRDLKKFYKD